MQDQPVGRDRRRRRRDGLCELIPKVQTLLVSHLERKESEEGAKRLNEGLLLWFSPHT